jgi:hypothetical protein
VRSLAGGQLFETNLAVSDAFPGRIPQGQTERQLFRFVAFRACQAGSPYISVTNFAGNRKRSPHVSWAGAPLESRKDLQVLKSCK